MPWDGGFDRGYGPRVSADGSQVLLGFTGVTSSATHAPASAPCWLAYGLPGTGLTLAGHVFDLGSGAKTVLTGTTGADGTVTLGPTGPVPAPLLGTTLHVELVVRSGGAWHDSNLLWLEVL